MRKKGVSMGSLYKHSTLKFVKLPKQVAHFISWLKWVQGHQGLCPLSLQSPVELESCQWLPAYLSELLQPQETCYYSNSQMRNSLRLRRVKVTYLAGDKWVFKYSSVRPQSPCFYSWIKERFRKPLQRRGVHTYPYISVVTEVLQVLWVVGVLYPIDSEGREITRGRQFPPQLLCWLINLLSIYWLYYFFSKLPGLSLQGLIPL